MDPKLSLGISIPFELLKERYLPLVLSKKIAVEIALKAEALDKFPRKDFKEVAGLLKNNGVEVTIHLPFMDLSLAALDPWIRKVSLKRIFQGMEIASLFEPMICVFHSGYHPDYHREPKFEWRNIFQEESLPEILKLSEDLGLVLALENVFEPDPLFLLPIFENFLGKLFWCFDPSHAKVFSERDEMEWLEILFRYLKEIHCHDTLGKWDDHLPMGKGIINYPGIFNFLMEHNLQIHLTLEAKSEKDAICSLNYLKESMGLKSNFDLSYLSEAK